jgi:hypothetical protein
LGAEHLERIPGLHHALRKAVRESKAKKKILKLDKGLVTLKLCDFDSLITFEFMICGSSSTKAQPSIIAYCPSKILEPLKKELQKSNTHAQYSEKNLGPCFDLYYCVREGPAYYRTWCAKAVTFIGSAAQDASGDSEYHSQIPIMCGARIDCVELGLENQKRSATLACVFEVKGHLFGLTSAHPFCSEDSLNYQNKLLEQLSQFDEDDDDCEITFEDEEGDLSSGGGGVAEEIFGHTMSSLLDASSARLGTADEPSTRPSNAEESSVIFPGPGDLGCDESDCDWAMIPIKWSNQQIQNAYSIERSSIQLHFVTKIAYEQPVTETPVHILTSSSIKNGTLLPGSVSLSGLSGRGYCMVLVISIKGPDGK